MSCTETEWLGKDAIVNFMYVFLGAGGVASARLLLGGMFQFCSLKHDSLNWILDSPHQVTAQVLLRFYSNKAHLWMAGAANLIGLAAMLLLYQ